MKKTESRLKLIKQLTQDIKVNKNTCKHPRFVLEKIFENFRMGKSLLAEIFLTYTRTPFWKL